MMHRREFLRRSALIAAGVVAADQIDLLEMLAPRRLFPSAAITDWNAYPPSIFTLDKIQDRSMFRVSYDYAYKVWSSKRNAVVGYTAADPGEGNAWRLVQLPSDLGGGSLPESR